MKDIAIWMNPKSRNYIQRRDVFEQNLKKYNSIGYEFVDNTNDLEFTPDLYKVVFAHESDIKHADIEDKLKYAITAKVVVFSGDPSENINKENLVITNHEAISRNLSEFLQNYYKTGLYNISIFAQAGEAVDEGEKAYHAKLKAPQFAEIINYLDTLDRGKILFADDDIPAKFLKQAYKHLILANSAKQVLGFAGKNEFSLIIMDIEFQNEDIDGTNLLLTLGTEIKTIMLSGYDDFENSLKAWKCGATYFISKHAFSLEYFRAIVELIDMPDMPVIISKSNAMQMIWQRMKLYSQLNQDILITGENGTGKELAARALYELGKPKHNYREFVAQNCAGIPDTLFESEIYGYKKGAFTGANNDKEGCLENADNGVLFLDEIGDMPIFQQAKMLRAIQEKRFLPVGGNVEQKFNAKIIYATNKDLQTEIEHGKFRKDLYFRMIGAEMRLPSLCERKEDIEMLAAWFVYKFIKNNDLVKYNYTFNLSESELLRLKNYSFPGNIRELEKMITQACIEAMLENRTDLYLEITQSNQENISTEKSEPILYSIEQIIKLLQYRVITSRGLSNQIKQELINHLLSKQTKTKDIAKLMGVKEQSLRNLKSTKASN